MYIRKIFIENYGAIQKFEYSLPFSEEGNPLPVIFVGKNGTGKTIVLSNIIHSLIEIKRKFYKEISEVSGNNFYRLGTKKYIRATANHAYFRVDFDDSYNIDLMVNDYEEFKEKFPEYNYSDIDLNDTKLKDNGYFSKTKKTVKNVFDENIFLYFPVDRYYIPTWENTSNENLNFITDYNTYIGKDKYGMAQYNLLNGLEAWLLDVIIDMMLYEGKETVVNRDGKDTIELLYEGPNASIQEKIDDILTKLYVNKKYTSVRIGISNKQHIKIAVVGRLEDGSEEEIAPKFSNLSSGEIMVLGIFSSIIREYDKINLKSTMNFEDIKGIVLIDEIDAHLHSDILKDVLPELIKIFPKLQFLVSSHSPFFLLGMKEKFDDKCEFVALPTGTVLDKIENFDEVRNCYSIIDDSYNSILEMRDQYEMQAKDLSRHLIITEGKTDWKHLKHALKKLQETEKFKELDIRYLEYDYEFSDSKLETLLMQLSKVPNSNKIIGIFDSDSSKGIAYSSVKNFGNNVYACCITDTMGYECGVSIELLYSRADLTRQAKDGRRIYLSDEFTKKSYQLKSNPEIVCHNGTLVDAFKRDIIKVVDSAVFNSKEESLALSKEAFASHILNEDDNFNDVSVVGFENIFITIQNILNGTYQ